VGAAIGSTENTARMRVTRALDKLQVGLKRRGIATSAAALSTVLVTGAVQSAPIGLATAISTSAILAGTATQTSTLIAANKIIAMTTFQKIIVGGALAVAVGTGIYQAHQATRLRDQLTDAQQQQAAQMGRIGQLQMERDDAVKRLAVRARVSAPTLPAPQIKLAAATNDPPDLQTNLHDRYLANAPLLNAVQVAAFLKANQTNSESLLAAYRTSKDPALLREAMEKFPNDPQVAFEALQESNLSADEQRQWLNTFKADDPGNALPNYLSAMNYFNAGQIDQGIQELSAASGKQLDDYTLDRIQGDEEAYASAGYSAAEAETIASQSLVIPQESQIKQLGADLVSLANAYRQSGDQSSAEATLQMAMNLGQNMIFSQSTEPVLISQLVGMSIEKTALSSMDPNSVYGSAGQTVQQQLDALAQERADIKAVAAQAIPLMQNLSDEDMLTFDNRRMIFGEVAAMQWVVSKYGRQ
ncbi:MAG TPA: hypothetical protein VNV43_10390, partial [Candidatus Acidoferrales bacterium]|nr:hypothetical protein [Candidatus Acidoferrales bacterium]